MIRRGTPRKRTTRTARRKTPKRTTQKAPKYVVTAKFTLKSKPVPARKKTAMVNKVRRSGGTATVRKVK